MARRDIDLEDCYAQDDYYSDPEQPYPDGRPCLPGEGAEALISEEILDLVQERVEYIQQHPEEAIPWEEFEVDLDEMFGPVPS